MPSKLRKAIGAVKDQTSISLAKVAASNNASNIGIAILKATTHDEVPIDEKYINEVLLHISSNKTSAAACAQAIGKRIGRTRNWIVALKSLMLVLRIFQDGDPYFPREVLQAMKRGSKILNLSSFRDDSNSSPWDYTAFVRTFALYLDERLDCFLMGKLQKRFAFREREKQSQQGRRGNEPVRDMKPAMLLDRISFWQRLLDRAIATQPTGSAKTNRLVQISLYAIVQESFDLYRDISDGLALLLDSFFHLQYQSCVNAFQTCVKASKQFEELCMFYDLCKSIGVGRTSEYPSVQKISDELIETLQEFLKDQASFPSSGRSSASSHLLLLAPPNSRSRGSSFELSESNEQFEPSETSERISEKDSESGLGLCASLEDLISVDDANTSPNLQNPEKQTWQDDLITADQRTASAIGLACLDEWPQQNQKEDHQEQEQKATLHDVPRDGWELVLAETASQSIPEESHIVRKKSFSTNSLDGLFDQTSSLPEHHNNPFLLDTTDLTVPATSSATAANAQLGFPGAIDGFPMALTFQATPPTFSASNPNQSGDDPSAPNFCASNPNQMTALQNGDDTFAPCSNGAAPPFCASNANQTVALQSGVDPFSACFSATAPIFCSGNPKQTATLQSGDDPFAACSSATAPTFCASNPSLTVALQSGEWDDPFAPLSTATTTVQNGSMNQQNLLQEQQLWLQNQNKIIAKSLS